MAFKDRGKKEKTDLEKLRDLLVDKKIVSVDIFRLSHIPQEGIKLTLDCGGNIVFACSRDPYTREGNLFYKVTTKEDILAELENKLKDAKEKYDEISDEYKLIKSLGK